MNSLNMVEVCLGKRYDCTLRDSINLKETVAQLTNWLKEIDNIYASWGMFYYGCMLFIWLILDCWSKTHNCSHFKAYESKDNL